MVTSKNGSRAKASAKRAASKLKKTHKDPWTKGKRSAHKAMNKKTRKTPREEPRIRMT